MVDIPRSSFVPKETSTAVPSQIRRRKTFRVFSFLTTTLLIFSVVGAGGVFFYKQTLQSKLNAMRQELLKQRKNFSQDKMDTVATFDMKIRAAEYLLNNHVAPLKVLTMLEDSTMQRVQFMNLTFTYDPGFEADVTLNGVTQQFTTVANQSLEFNRSGSMLADTVFNNVGLSSKAEQTKSNTGSNADQVNFTVSGPLDLKSIMYDANIPVPQLMRQQQNTNQSLGTTTPPAAFKKTNR